MTRFTIRLGILSLSLVWGQQDWQGEVKKIYPVNVPAFQGVNPVFGLATKTGLTP